MLVNCLSPLLSKSSFISYPPVSFTVIKSSSPNRHGFIYFVSLSLPAQHFCTFKFLPLIPTLFFSQFFWSHPISFIFSVFIALSLCSSLIKAGNKPPPATPGKPKKATTFQEFESITSDAWDVGDDDDELLAMAAQNLNIEVVMETANKVNKHMRSGEILSPIKRWRFTLCDAVPLNIVKVWSTNIWNRFFFSKVVNFEAQDGFEIILYLKMTQK